MSIMRLENGASFIEMDVAFEQDVSLQSHGDANVAFNLMSNGFGGHSKSWVYAEEFSAFRMALIVLEQSLKGEATLESISPNELKLRIYAVNSRGYLAVEGETGRSVLAQDKMFWHSVSFGFTFEPQQLRRALSLSWLHP